MKRLISAFLCFTVILSFMCLFGCNSANKSTPDEGSSTADSAVTAPLPNASATTKIITVNMMYPIVTDDDYIQYKGQKGADYSMKKRFVRFCALVDYFSPDVLMLQEINGRGGWWDYLITNSDGFLARYPKYAYLGNKNMVGGTNGSGSTDTFYNQIYYNTTKFELLGGGTFFCRDDRTKAETQYDGDYEGVYAAHNTTTCTYAVLRDKKTNISCVYATTHLCTRPTATYNFRSYGQARTLTEGLNEIAEEYKWGENALPIAVGGDFNGSETDGNFYAYKHMTREAHYSDSKKVAQTVDNSGTARIFGAQTEGKNGTSANGNRIDYIFEQGGEVTDYRVLSGTFAEDAEQSYCEYHTEATLDGSEYDLTDHLPVFVKLKIGASGCSVSPDTYVNARAVSDVIVGGAEQANATSTKIVFDWKGVLDAMGGNLNKGMSAALVADGNGVCLRLTAVKSRVDSIISIDVAALLSSIGQTAVSAETYTKIKVEYSLSLTYSPSKLYLGISTDSSIPVSVGVNSLLIDGSDGWQTSVFDFSTISENYRKGSYLYLAVAAANGLMAGDGIYIRSIEFE